MSKKTRIAKELLRLAKSLVADKQFDMEKNTAVGPEHVIKVAKTGSVYAHQITEDDADAIRSFSAREGEYGDEYKTPGNWICTSDISKAGGDVWIVKDKKFRSSYSLEEDRSRKMTREVCGMKIDFYYHAPSDATYECFRLPTSGVPAEMHFGGQKFFPGDYVFIENGECDIWARSAEAMKNYTKVGDVGKAPAKVFKQYDEMINSGSN